ncbi:MAG: 16S rRNA (cytosine(1402)-N(4))-methyltransferase RsmH [Clostridia bacterium]|nr:16S rRNA (cytosine(1402)-N(4))-methyltransferase RsmH [Clostridia bacterium]
MEFNHVPVLLDQCIECLNIKEGGVYVDGTLGGGGHSSCVLKRLNNTGRLIGIDRDSEALAHTSERLKEYSNVTYVKDNHENIKNILLELGIDKVDGILLDLGVSSYQLDEPSRGFSYMHDAALDMRMNKDQDFTAYDVVNKYSEERLTEIFSNYGEEKYSKSIARKIVETRREKEIKTTFQLVDIIKSAIPAKARNEKQHPAKRVFQAIRIEVNGELVDLENALKDAVMSLREEGRLLVITFHSLEDRIVKKTFENLQGKCTCPPDFPKCICGFESFGKIITKKPIIATDEELEQNPRSRSAKLRVFERQ